MIGITCLLVTKWYLVCLIVSIAGFLQSIASKNEWAHYRAADYCSEEGRSSPYLLLSTTLQSFETSKARSSKLRVWIQGAVHGNEPAGDQSVLALIGKMDANQPWTKSILDNMDILFLPRYNPDGVSLFQRALVNNLDANRDHIRLASQETRNIKQSFNGFAPHIAIDLHEFSAPRVYAERYVHASDALYSAAKNLNIHPKIRQMSEDLFAANMSSALASHGLRGEVYITGDSLGSKIAFSEASSDAKLGRNAMGLTQAIAFLCETRGIGLGDQHFRRRTMTSLVMAESIIQTAANNAEQVYQTIEESIEDFIGDTPDIVITDSTTELVRTFPMIDFTNGSIVEVPVQFASSTPTIASVTRRRPEAYLISPAWAELASRLKTYGLKVERLADGFQGKVEALKITSVTFDETYYEGVVAVTVTTTSRQTNIKLPSGAIRISTRQRNAALAFMALEPESIDSYVACNIIPVQVGDEYPVYRLME